MNFAARVGAAALGGEVVVSEAVWNRVQGEGFTFGAPLAIELKGFSGTHTVYRVHG